MASGRECCILLTWTTITKRIRKTRCTHRRFIFLRRRRISPQSRISHSHLFFSFFERRILPSFDSIANKRSCFSRSGSAHGSYLSIAFGYLFFLSAIASDSFTRFRESGRTSSSRGRFLEVIGRGFAKHGVSAFDMSVVSSPIFAIERNPGTLHRRTQPASDFISFSFFS